MRGQGDAALRHRSEQGGKIAVERAPGRECLVDPAHLGEQRDDGLRVELEICDEHRQISD